MAPSSGSKTPGPLSKRPLRASEMRTPNDLWPALLGQVALYLNRFPENQDAIEQELGINNLMLFLGSGSPEWWIRRIGKENPRLDLRRAILADNQSNAETLLIAVLSILRG